MEQTDFHGVWRLRFDYCMEIDSRSGFKTVGIVNKWIQDG